MTTYTIELEIITAAQLPDGDPAKLDFVNDTYIHQGVEYKIGGDPVNGLVIKIPLGTSGGGGASVALTPELEASIMAVTQKQDELTNGQITLGDSINALSQSQTSLSQAQSAITQQQSQLTQSITSRPLRACGLKHRAVVGAKQCQQITNHMHRR